MHTPEQEAERNRRADVHPEVIAALELAVRYLGKVVADGLFEDCAMHPRQALDRCEAALLKGLNRAPDGHCAPCGFAHR